MFWIETSLAQGKYICNIGAMKGIMSTKYGARRRLFPRTCKQCKGKFYLPKHFFKTIKCCSNACRIAGSRSRVKLTCAMCEIEFERTPSKLVRSKSRLYFCGRPCKEKAQCIGGLTAIQPPHYGNQDGKTTYRKRAFDHYGKACAKCGYKLFERMLDVHHRDGNRRHNKLENLIVLCVWCHALETRRIPFHLPGTKQSKKREVAKGDGVARSDR